MVNGLCLDFDGTLGRFQGDFAGIIEELRHELGLLHCDFETFAHRLAVALQSDGHLDTEIALRRVLEDLEVRPPVDLPQIAEYAAQQYAKDVTPLTGALELLEYTREQNIPVALVSNGPVDMQRGAVERLGVEGYFSAILISGDRDVAARKPAPRIFGLACTALRSLPEETLMVGDSLENDVRGARGYGLQTVLVRARGGDEQRSADAEESGMRVADEAFSAAAESVAVVAHVGELVGSWLR